jgi:hypothetical protein
MMEATVTDVVVESQGHNYYYYYTMILVPASWPTRDATGVGTDLLMSCFDESELRQCSTILRCKAGASACESSSIATLKLKTRGFATDSKDIVYFSSGNCIKTLSPSGEIKIFVGKEDQHGSVDGRSDVARSSCPAGIAFDSKDRLIFCDLMDYKIRCVTTNADGVSVSTMAGSGRAQVRDGKGVEASFNFPRYIVIDTVNGRDDAYIADGYPSPLRKVTTDGQVTTINFFNDAGMGYSNLAINLADSMLYIDDGSRIGTIDITSGTFNLINYSTGRKAENPFALVVDTTNAITDADDGVEQTTLIASNITGIIRIAVPTRNQLIVGVNASSLSLQRFPPGLLPMMVDYLSQ